MNSKGRPGRKDAPAGLDKLDDIEPPSATQGALVGLGGEETLRRLLDDDALALTEDDAKGTTRRIQPNPGGLKKGYDPYDSGMLLKKQWKKKKDLRALSRWIEQKKKRDGKD